MADILTSIKAIVPNQASVNAVAAASGDLNGMLNEAQEKASGLLVSLGNLANALASNDSNLVTVNGAETSVLTAGKFDFANLAQSGHVLTFSSFA